MVITATIAMWGAVGMAQPRQSQSLRSESTGPRLYSNCEE